jgi:pyrroline-5-carboxylate reductase
MKIAIIGCGNLGTSLARGLLRAKEAEIELHLCDRSIAKIERIAGEFPNKKMLVTSDPREAARGAEVVVIVVKPKDMHKCLEYMHESIAAETLIISCAAGIETQAMEEALGHKAAIARAMPNTALSVGAGTTGAFLGPNCIAERDEKRLRLIFGAISDVDIVPKEDSLHTVAALAASGPAFVLVMLEAMIEAGVRSGLSRKDAEFFAKGAFKGATALMLQSDLSPSDLRAQITSPGGMTAQGLYCLEKGQFRATVMDAVEWASLRSEDLAFMHTSGEQ